MLKGADIVLQCLRAEGVELVFGYPGGAIMPLYDALEGSGIRHILTRHEQGAVFAAEGYARVTGEVGVAMATSGPGATNLVTGIADAKMDSVPLVCITGQVRSALIGTDAFQETDVFGVTLSLTKWSRLVRTIDEIPEAIAEGFYWARSGRPGPVVIDIPTDMLKAKKEFSGPVKFTPHARPADAQAEGGFTDTIVALLQQSSKPVALVGAGAKLSGAIPELRRLLDHLNVPTFATVHGLGAVPPQAPYYLGMVGMHGTRAANTALSETDLLMVFGARLDDRVTGEPTRFAPHAKIVHFEIDPAQLDRVRPCDLPVIGNLADTIPAFQAELRRHTVPDFSKWRSVACGAERAELDPRGLAQPTIRFLDELFSRLPENNVVLADVGQHQMWAAQRYRSSSPRGFITSGGLGAMGSALPAGTAGGFARAGGTGGGLGGSTTVSSALEKLLEQDASSYKWVAAAEGSEAAAPLQLATGDAVMAIGGFNGTDPWPTLAAFKELVAKHEVHYYVGQGSESFGGGQGSSAIVKWVAANFKKETVGGQTVYNLTEPTS